MHQSLLLQKRKMQEVSFKSVEECLDYIPANELSLVTKLREIIFQAIPDCHEKLAYNVPYYKRHANGFTKGYLLNDVTGYLDQGNRKEVAYKDFTHPDEIDESVLIPFLLCAADVDEALYQSRKAT